MRLYFSYLKLHYKSIILFLIFAALFVLTFYLYRLPLEPVLYSVVLCIVTGVVFSVISFSRFYRRHKILSILVKNAFNGIDALPEARNIYDRDYNEIIHSLFNAKCQAESDKAITIAEMNDYYTLWVHQIKTPIAAMHLLLQNSTENNSETEEQLFKIEQYVEMVMTYLRSSNSVSDYVIRRHKLDDIVKGAIRKYAKLFIRKKLSVEFKETGLTIITDEKWLSFVIEQIISNAVKYTSKGRVSIYSENVNTLVIEDTGIGIAPEDLPRVCEKGYTGYNGRADKKSTGIGLYLCSKLLKNLSHKLEIQSEVGKGTKVMITFGSTEKIYE